MELYFGIGIGFVIVLFILLLFSYDFKNLFVPSALYLIPTFLIIIIFWPFIVLAVIFSYIYPIHINNHRLF